VEEQYEEEQAIAGSPPKMLPPPFPMNPAGAASMINNPPVPGNEEQRAQAQAQGQGQGPPMTGKAASPMPEQEQGREGKVGSE
jgi:hypothetical protein